MKPAFAGLLVIAACVVLLGWLIPDEEVRRPMWLFVFLMLAACAKFSWSHPKAPQSPRGWFLYIGLAIALGLAVAALDVLLYGLGSALVTFDLALSMLAGIVALSGWAHSLALNRENGA
jgi:hypothetical protein